MILMTPCLPSENRINDRGYPIVWHEGKHCREHRLVYVRSRGLKLSDIQGLEVRHRCDNTVCINEEHLEIGTHADNMRDMAERGRANPLRGSSHPVSKLVEADVPVIRRLIAEGRTQRNVARQFGVDQAIVGRIARGVAWSHVA